MLTPARRFAAPRSGRCSGFKAELRLRPRGDRAVQVRSPAHLTACASVCRARPRVRGRSQLFVTGWPPKLAMNRLTHKNDFFFHRAHARAHATTCDSARFASARAAASEEATLAQAAGCGGAAKSERTSPLRTADPRRRHSCLPNRWVGSCAHRDLCAHI